MEKMQVLVATMHQKNMDILQKMNISCSAVIANQADRNEIQTCGNVKMITTMTRGVGLNRNIALLASDADLLLFADDDVQYYDDMHQNVVRAFAENPQADVLVFGMDMTKNGEVYEQRHHACRRLHVWNAMRFGTYRIAIRRNAWLKANILFNQNFGGGCPFSAGEDSLFLKACFDQGLRVYAHDYVLGRCAKDTSSWFTGHNQKYFYDKGVLMRHLFPRIPYAMALYFGIRFKRDTELSVKQRIYWMMKGVKAGKTMTVYEDRT